MKTNPVVWFEIYVDNMERATKFYETVFNLKLENLLDPTEDSLQMKVFPSEMENMGASGSLVKMEGYNAGSNSTLVYFHSEDCITEENRVEEAGGKVFKPKMSIGEYGFISLLVDTEGNMIGLHSLK